jgi:5-hydroxyisourate hydrolase-like protein (transthyretin family)
MKMSSVTRVLAALSVLLLLTFSLYSRAQTLRQGTLTGKLLDADTNEPIPNATVVLLRTADNALVSTATTRADGSFTVARVPFGQYSFRTTVLGYRAQFPQVAFHAAQPLVAWGALALQPLSQQVATAPAAPRIWLASAR